jgi:hypothetical protein
MITAVLLFDKTLLGLTDFLPLFRPNRVLIIVSKQAPGSGKEQDIQE